MERFSRGSPEFRDIITGEEELHSEIRAAFRNSYVFISTGRSCEGGQSQTGMSGKLLGEFRDYYGSKSSLKALFKTVNLKLYGLLALEKYSNVDLAEI